MPEMSDQAYQDAITGLVDDAERFMEDDIHPQREEALNYLRGETNVPPPETGFSGITSTVSRDSLHIFMRELMKIFAGAGSAVEFIGGDNDGQLAEQQTDVANYILMIRNGGWRTMHDVFRSAVGSASVAGMKVYWDESRSVWQEEFTDLSDEEMEELEDDPNAEIIEQETITEEEQIPFQLPDGSEVRETVKRRTHNAKVKWDKPANKIAIDPIVGEELYIDRRATDQSNAKIISHGSQRTRSDLISLGMTDDFIDRNGGSGGSGDDTSQQSQEKRARTGFDPNLDDGSSSNKEVQTYQLWDSYVTVDRDGDGIAEWRHNYAIGDQAIVWEESDEMVSGPQIITFIPFVKENTVIGETLHELTKDIADSKTCLQRGMIDNLGLTNFPKPVAVEGMISNWASIQNRKAVAVVKHPNALQYLPTPYVVQGVLEGMQYLDSETSSRIGVSKASMGLDPDVLQSSSDFGVRETFGQGAGGVAFVARNLAETGMIPLFQLIIQLYARHQKEPETLRLNGKVVDVNPRQFDHNMDLKANVGLGTGDRESKQAVLMFALQQQKETLASTPDGQPNEITSPQQVVNTLDKILELHDISDEGQFFHNPVLPPPPQRQDPAEAAVAAAQAEAQVKGQIDIQKQQMQSQADIQKALIQSQSDERQAIIEQQTKLVIAEAQLGQSSAIDQAKLQLQARKDMIDGALRQEELDRETILEVRAQDIEATLDGEKIRQAQLRRPN